MIGFILFLFLLIGIGAGILFLNKGAQAQKIKELEPRSWIFLLFSLKEKDNQINLKENKYFVNKYDDYSKLDWKETIKGFHLPDEEMNKNLENFTTQVIN